MKTPLLSTVFRALAWINGIAGVIAVVALLQTSMSMALIYGCSAIVGAIVMAGLAEAIEYLAETAYYAKLTYELQRGDESTGKEDPAADLLRNALR